MARDSDQAPAPIVSWRAHLHEIIFEADTRAGKAFDVALLILILLSVGVVVLDSVAEIQARMGPAFRIFEWIFTALFTIEYVLRILTVRRPLKYIFSFFGIVDLLAILPAYFSLVLAGTESLVVIRALRLLRVFRVLKLAHFVGESQRLRKALHSSARKIVVFLGAVLTIVLIVGSLMYLIEGSANGFTSIPQSIYWAIVTLTTVGYGDIAPATIAGKALASIVMILGYGIIAVPTGIATVEITEAMRRPVSTQVCANCSLDNHEHDAVFCKRCGTKL